MACLVQVELARSLRRRRGGSTGFVNVISNVSRQALTSARLFIRATTLRNRVIITLAISIGTAPAVVADRFRAITTYFTSSARYGFSDCNKSLKYIRQTTVDKQHKPGPEVSLEL